MKKTCLFLAALFLVIVFFFVGVQAEEPPSLQAFRTDLQILVDGKLLETVWQTKGFFRILENAHFHPGCRIEKISDCTTRRHQLIA